MIIWAQQHEKKRFRLHLFRSVFNYDSTSVVMLCVCVCDRRSLQEVSLNFKSPHRSPWEMSKSSELADSFDRCVGSPTRLDESSATMSWLTNFSRVVCSCHGPLGACMWAFCFSILLWTQSQFYGLLNFCPWSRWESRCWGVCWSLEFLVFFFGEARVG